MSYDPFKYGPMGGTYDGAVPLDKTSFTGLLGDRYSECARCGVVTITSSLRQSEIGDICLYCKDDVQRRRDALARVVSGNKLKADLTAEDYQTKESQSAEQAPKVWDTLFSESLVGKSSTPRQLAPKRKIESKPKDPPKPKAPQEIDRLYWVMKEIESEAETELRAQALCSDCGTTQQPNSRCCVAEIKRLKRK